jgi:hypothetical protein
MTTTYVMSGSITVELVTDRAKLIDLDVPMETDAVVVITSGKCKHVLDIKLIQSIAATFPRLTSASAVPSPPSAASARLPRSPPEAS